MRTALITGSSGSIGAAIAEQFTMSGLKVFLTGRDEGKLKIQAKKCEQADYLKIDLIQDGATEALFEAAKSSLGQIDVLINNAGTYEWGLLERLERLEETLKLNVQVPIELCQLVLPDMKKRKTGRIVNIGSISGAVGEANASIYSASKAALIGFSKALALEVAADGITVNVVNPGWVKTPMVISEIERGNLDEELELETVPQRRWVEPDEVAAMIVHLCKPQSRGITGQSINICAGLSLG